MTGRTSYGAPMRLSLRKRTGARIYALLHSSRPSFECPICGFRGPFRERDASTGVRMHAQCPACGSLERHRLQHLVLTEVLRDFDCGNARCLHFAPEAFFRRQFAAVFGDYQTADIAMAGVDHRVDLQALPFADASYDFVYASHVLEHIRDDEAALREIRRILRPGGIAILPVPVVGPHTVEYPAPNPNETMHVRAPGPDYFDRYRPHFSRVTVRTSSEFPAEFQTFVHEDRRGFPRPGFAHRLAMAGDCHRDFVPVCQP